MGRRCVPSRRMVAALLAAVAMESLAWPAAGAPPLAPSPNDSGPARCGTSDLRLIEALARHARWAKRETRQAERAVGAAPPGDERIRVRFAGDVMVIEDDGQLVHEMELFDLERRAVAFDFRRKRQGYRVRSLGSGLQDERGDRLELGDDDSRRIDLPFRVPFYGGRYDAIWVNSDGNLTFEEGDSAAIQRDLGRVLGGPPRIAPLFDDLDPSRTSGESGIFVLVTPSLLRVTWVEVPEFGKSNRNTLQATITKRGRISFAFGDVDARSAVVGISPGRVAGLKLVDFRDDLPIPITSLAIAEVFAAGLTVDEATLSQTVLRILRDEYAGLVLFTDFPIHLGLGAVAYHILVRNQVLGIGGEPFDFSQFWGSDGVLESFVMMGEIGKYGDDLGQPLFGTFTSLDVALHEQGHRWLAYVRFKKRGRPESRQLLGRQLAHWSYYLDSDASFLEGNEIRDNGDGSFTTLARDHGFSPLDLYLMGLVGPEQVPDFFFVDGTGLSPDQAPAFHQTFRGQRVNVGIEDVIRAEGRRQPGVEDSPKRLAIAWMLLARADPGASADSIAKVDRFRRQATQLLEQSTGGRMEIDTRLRIR